MLELSLIFIVGLLAAILIVNWIIFSKTKSVKKIPGLNPTSKESGNLEDMAKAGSLHEFLMGLHEKFGGIVGFWWGKTYVVSIGTPDLMNQHQHVFDRPVLLFKSFERLIGPKCIQYANGEDGKNRRRAYDTAFSHNTISQYMFYFDDCAKRAEADWLSKGPDDHIALHEQCFVYAIHAAALSILGDYYNDMSAFFEFKKAYEAAWYFMEKSIINPAIIKEEDEKNFEIALNFIRGSILKAIAHRRENDLHLKNNQFIDLLIESTSNEEIIVSDAIAYLIGSFHTSGNLITWAMYYIASNQDVQDKAFEEIDSILGKDAYVDENNFSQFVYLMQIMDEALRCAVIAPWAARFQDVDSELDGYILPKDTPVIHALGVVSKDPKRWANPDKFDPGRFSPENRKKMTTFDFVPYGFAGKRKCPGYRFAYWDVGVFLATMIRRFKINLVNDQKMTPIYGLVTHPAEEIWVKVVQR